MPLIPQYAHANVLNAGDDSVWTTLVFSAFEAFVEVGRLLILNLERSFLRNLNWDEILFVMIFDFLFGYELNDDFKYQ